MSRPLLKKDSSYSEFRRKNSLSKPNLHTSMIDIIEQELSLIADDNTSQLLNMENQIQSIIRNRSLSAKPAPKSPPQDSLKLIFDPKQEAMDDAPLHILKPNSVQSIPSMQNYPKTNRSIQYPPFTQTFEIIEQSEIYNEEDNGQQQSNKIPSTKGAKNEKPPVNKRKNSNQLTASSKLEKKVTINELDEMQKRLESAKKKTKLELKDIVNQKKIMKKVELPVKAVLGQKTERRIQRTNSQAVMVTERTGYKVESSGYEKEKEVMTPKPMLKRKLTLSESMKLQPGQKQVKQQKQVREQKQVANELIPTKLVNGESKQKLLKQFDRIKQSIRNSDISGQNMESIKKMLKTMQGLIN